MIYLDERRVAQRTARLALDGDAAAGTGLIHHTSSESGSIGEAVCLPAREATLSA